MENDIIPSAAVLTVSDKGSRGERQDTAGPELCRILEAEGYLVQRIGIVPDEVDAIAAGLCEWSDEGGIDLILTAGGTGVAPSDRTPEATRPLLDREVPGIAEAMRQVSLLKTPNAVLSRGIAGIRGQSLIINLPGSQKAARENLMAVLPALKHAIYKIKGGMDDCGSGNG